MTLDQLFSLPIGTRLAWKLEIPGSTAKDTLTLHYRDDREAILRRDGDSGYHDHFIYRDGQPWTADDLSILEFRSFPPDRNGHYLYREIRELETVRATIESHVWVIDGTLSLVGHEHDLQPVTDLTVGPRAIGEWALIYEAKPHASSE